MVLYELRAERHGDRLESQGANYGLREDIVLQEREHGMKLSRRDPDRVWGWGTPAGRLRADRRAAWIMRAAGLGPGMRVLEIGCGTGIFTQFFARTGAYIVALDLSPELLDKARRRCGAFTNVQFHVGRFEDCRFSDPFDAIVGSSVLHHLELKAALEKIRGLLRPGGRASFAEPNILNPQIFLQKNVMWLKKRLGDTPHETAFFRWRLQRQLERHGFVGVKITPFDWLHPLTPLFLIRPVSRAGKLLEKIAVLRELAGSLLIRARRPL